MGLCELANGKHGVVVGIEAGCSAREKLFELGLIPGVPVKMLQQGSMGPILLEVLGSRVMLGQGLARKVTIK